MSLTKSPIIGFRPQTIGGFLVGGWTNPFEKYARQIGSSSPRFGVKIKNIWNHHLAFSRYNQFYPKNDSMRIDILGGSSQLVLRNPHLQAMNGHLDGEQPQLGDLLTMVINQVSKSWDDPPNIQPRYKWLQLQRAKVLVEHKECWMFLPLECSPRDVTSAVKCWF